MLASLRGRRVWIVAGAACLALLSAARLPQPRPPASPPAAASAPLPDPALARILFEVRPQAHVLRAVAVDIDRDGDVDVVASTVEEPIVILLNDGRGHMTREAPAASDLIGSGPVRVAGSEDAGPATGVPPSPKWWIAPVRAVAPAALTPAARTASPLRAPFLPGEVVGPRTSRAPPSHRRSA